MGWVKIRCPVCNGSGSVEPGFGCGGEVTSDKSCKKCPACEGKGWQEVQYPAALPAWREFPIIPPSPWHRTKEHDLPSPCDTCWFTEKMRRCGGHYVGDTPCEWCKNNPRKVTFRS
jgi:hypothetical protein